MPVVTALQLFIRSDIGENIHKQADSASQLVTGYMYLRQVELSCLRQQLLPVVCPQLAQLFDEGPILLDGAVQSCQLAISCRTNPGAQACDMLHADCMLLSGAKQSSRAFLLAALQLQDVLHC